MRMRSFVIATMIAACGPNVPRRTSEAPPEVRVSDEDLPAGTCAGLGELELGAPLALLAGRVLVRGPRGMADVPRPHNIMAAPPSAEIESRLFLDREGTRLVVFAEELLRTPTDDLIGAVRAVVGEDYRVSALEVEAPLRAAIAIPRELDTSDEAVELAAVFTVTPDGLAQRVGFYVTPDAAEDGGCERLALALAGTMTAGHRDIPDEPGARVLEGTIGIDLPADHWLLVEEGPDFSVYRVYPVLPLGVGTGSLGIYLGGHPSLRSREGATRVAGRVAGRAVQWEDSTADGVHFRQTLVELSAHRFAHVFFASDDAAAFDGLRTVAESLREGVSPPPLAACSDVSELPAVEAHAEVLAILALQTLLRTEEFTTYRQSWDRARIEPTEAFFALAAHPRAAEAFLYLAVHGTTAGKLYGLLGLYHHDRDRFEQIACAVGGVLEREVTVRRACGTTRALTSELFERRDGARGQRHFTPSQWRSVLASAPADVRGGGLAWEIAIGPRDAGEIARSGWEISGEGWVPALDPGDQRAAAMPPFAEGEHTVRTTLNQAGGVCRTRDDGAVACWGSTPATELSGARRLPEWVRWPSRIAIDLGLGCVLDARGSRACFALIDRTLDERAAACPGTTAPRGVVMRRFEDGPWRELYAAGDVCGVHDDGTVWCFSSSSQYRPQWSEPVGTGIGSGYRVPVTGEVMGIAPAYLGATVLWTRDGTIWAWSTYDAPAVIGRVEGVVDVTGGNDGEWYFARTGDGRVFVRGTRGDRPYWSSFPDEEGTFVEVPELRGATVWLGDHHGCSLVSGTVRCWGQHAGYLPGVEDGDDRTPEEVATLRGARSLWLGEWMTCGDMPSGSWRCVGSHQASISNRRVPEDRLAPYDVRLDRIAASIR
jgi:hypothetical protein